MARRSGKKPRNVVKSRTEPSLLGGSTHARKKEELPSNRFIELGDIALGNSGRREVITQSMIPEAEFVMPSAPHADAPGASRTPGPPRLNLRKPLISKPPRQAISKPNLRLPKASLPKAPKPVRPPAVAPPKPPKVYRPKPKVGTALKNSSKPRKKT